MRRFSVAIIFLLLSLGCAVPDQVLMKVSASRSLGLDAGKPTKVEVCLYQLKRVEAFRELRSHPDGLARLYECSRFHESVVTVETFEVEPGARFERTVKRVGEAGFMGAVVKFPGEPGGPVARYAPFKDDTVHLYLGKDHISFH